MPLPFSYIQAVIALLLFTYGAALLGTLGPGNNPLHIALIWYGAATFFSIIFTSLSPKGLEDLKSFLHNPKKSGTVLFFGVGDGLFWFMSLLALGLAASSIVNRISLVLIVAYSLFILKEKPSRSEILVAVCMVAFGFIFVFGKGIDIDVFDYGVALLWAIFSAGFLISKKYGSGVIRGLPLHTARAFLIWMCVLIFGLITAGDQLFTISMPWWHVALFASGGLSNAIFGQYFRMQAYKDGERLLSVSLIMALGTVFVFVYGIFILDEPANAIQILAATGILGLSLLLTYLRARETGKSVS